MWKKFVDYVEKIMNYVEILIVKIDNKVFGI